VTTGKNVSKISETPSQLEYDAKSTSEPGLDEAEKEAQKK
jgi:hypothetical protein